MSRGYRIMVSSVSSVVSASDELCIAVSLLPVLGAERMHELLRAALRADGWIDADDNELELNVGNGLSARLLADGSRVVVERTAQRTVKATATTKAGAEAALASKTAETAAELQHVATTSLAACEGDVRARLEAAVQHVYGAALEEKARSLGHLESVQRTVDADGTVELVLKVRT
jgi:hypothetical protein